MEMNAERIMALVRLVVPLCVYAATFAGIALDADFVYCVLLVLCGIAATIWTWWKNNNVTTAAQEAQRYLDAIKAGYIDERDLVAAMPSDATPEDAE